MRAMKPTSAVARVAILLILAACTPRFPAADPQELIEADRAFARATAERGAEGWASFFSDSGRMIPNGQAEVRGRSRIEEAMAPLLSDPDYSLTWEPEGAEISAGGNLGYTWGRYSSRRLAPEGGEQISQGRYLTIWRRQTDGSWKVELDMGNALPED